MSAAERRAFLSNYEPALMLLVDIEPVRVFDETSEGELIDGGFSLDRLWDALSGGGVNVILWRDYAVANSFRSQYSKSTILQFFRVEMTSWFDAGSKEFGAVHIPDRGHPAPDLTNATVHLRQRNDGEGVLISRSVHSLEAAQQAERDGADLLVLGTVFPSRSHPGGETIGIDGVRAVCGAVTIPMIGIGGITAQNAGDVIRAGASGVAVISAIFDAPDLRAAAAELRAAIDAAWAERGPEN